MDLKRFFGYLAAAALGAFLFADAALGAPANRYAAFVVDAGTGQVLHEANPDQRRHPASLTKMMTLYLVFEALERGTIKLNSPIVFSARAARQPPSRLDVRAGDSITVHEAIQALVTKSANDVAAAVGETLAGTESAFARRMTTTARRLGMSRTTFQNASGLPDDDQVSTARDMATLGLALLRDFPQRYSYFSTPQFVHDGAAHRNHNALLETYEGTDGIKTGYIRQSGFNLVASAKRDGHRLVGVVFGGSSPGQRNAHMSALLDKGFAALAGGERPAAVRVAALTPQVAEPEEGQGDEDAPARVAAARGGAWMIQVGAYGRHGPAYEAAAKAMSTLPRDLAAGSIDVDPLKTRNRTLFRARVVGLDQRQATAACKTLRARGGECMAMRLAPGT